MVACRKLGAERGIPEHRLKDIDSIHKFVEEFTEDAIKGRFSDDLAEVVLTQADYTLQEKWGFPQEQKYHTLWKKYQFRKQWARRVFECLETGIQFTVPDCVGERDFFIIGKGFLDVGRLNAYSRHSGIKEVKESVAVPE